MPYTLRHRKQNATREYTNDPENDSHGSDPDCLRGSDPDYSSSMPRRPTKTRNTTLSTPRAIETEMAVSSVDLIARHRRGRRSRPSKKKVEGEQNKETSEIGQSSNMNRGSFSPEGPSSCMQNGSPSPEGQSSSMKRGSSHEGTSSSKKTILSWLIDCKLIEEYEQVCYMDDTKASAALTGRITRGGILCSCCQKEISVWTFEKHSGTDLKQPYERIYLLKKATCLQGYQIAAWHEARERKRREIFSFVTKGTATEQNDDVCSICGDGEDLICCDKCPSTFHANCMNMERVPPCDWLCPYCVCKYCGLGAINKQLITCSRRDKNFHWGCFKEFTKESIEMNCSRLYCGPICRDIYEKLDSSLAARTDIFENYSWRVILPMDMTPKVRSAFRNQHLENNSNVAVACMLMNESFETITDGHTGINLVQSLAYSRGSDLNRINFSRFYTFIVEKEDAIICAASMRIHGRRVAEMPLIATDETYRGQGICGMLLMVIESVSVPCPKLDHSICPGDFGDVEAKVWLQGADQRVKREIASYNILMFPHALRLYKDLRTRRSRAAPNGGKENKNIETDNQNAREPQKDHAERALPDLNLDPPEEDQ